MHILKYYPFKRFLIALSIIIAGICLTKRSLNAHVEIHGDATWLLEQEYLEAQKANPAISPFGEPEVDMHTRSEEEEARIMEEHRQQVWEDWENRWRELHPEEYE